MMASSERETRAPFWATPAAAATGQQGGAARSAGVTPDQDDDDGEEGEEQKQEGGGGGGGRQEYATSFLLLEDALGGGEGGSMQHADVVPKGKDGGDGEVTAGETTTTTHAVGKDDGQTSLSVLPSTAVLQVVEEADKGSNIDDDTDTVTGEQQDDDDETSMLLLSTSPLETEVGPRTIADVVDVVPPLEQQAALFGSVTSPVNSRQDYRLDFTEVEGTLEAVPEEGTAAMGTAMTTHTSVASSTVITDPIATSAAIAPAAGSIASSSAVPAPSAVSNPIHSVPSAPSSVYIHIPESNASDVAFSEYSYQAESVGTQYSSSFIRSSEPLTARQQVALWLTRTSMSDVGSMPSLRSLVFPKSSSSARGHSTVGRGFRLLSTGGVEKTARNKAEMQRNFSTKSLISHSAAKEGKMMVSTPPMRKCNTMMSLPGSGSGVPGVSSSSSRPGQNESGHSGAAGGSSRSRKSSLSLFRRLARRDRGGKMPSSAAAFSFTSVGSGCESPYRMYAQGMQPVNRLRSSSSRMCSYCTSVISYNTSRLTSRAPSQISINVRGDGRRASTVATEDPEVVCKVCLMDTPAKDMGRLTECGCTFCKECLQQYITFEVMAGAYDISCPDPACDRQGVLQPTEVESVAGREVSDKHKAFRLNTEVALDRSRAWCPAPDCGTICHICDPPDAAAAAGTVEAAVAVSCPNCSKEFCSLCSANSHPGKTCQQNGQELVQRSLETSGGGTQQQPPGSEWLAGLDRLEGDVKNCPMCRVPIERDAGCAQMMCKRCKHVFCWFCLQSLDDDFLLRHYDSGRCKGKLGHSRASVLFHRAQVIGIFAGFGILLLVASPLLLLAAPCILCCRCKILEKLDPEGGRNESGGGGGGEDGGGDVESKSSVESSSAGGGGGDGGGENEDDGNRTGGEGGGGEPADVELLEIKSSAKGAS